MHILKKQLLDAWQQEQIGDDRPANQFIQSGSYGQKIHKSLFSLEWQKATVCQQ